MTMDAYRKDDLMLRLDGVLKEGTIIRISDHRTNQAKNLGLMKIWLKRNGLPILFFDFWQGEKPRAKTFGEFLFRRLPNPKNREQK